MITNEYLENCRLINENNRLKNKIAELEKTIRLKDFEINKLRGVTEDKPNKFNRKFDTTVDYVFG